MGTSFENVLYVWTSIFCEFWKRQAPRNDEDPSNKISKIIDMKPISIKKHEWYFANMVPMVALKRISLSQGIPQTN